MSKTKTLLMITVLSSTLCACASNVQTGELPQNGLTVNEIYRDVLSENDEPNAMKQMTTSYSRKANYSGYTRTATNETRSLFKVIDNPKVPIYVYPHVAKLGDEQIMKPGFTTEFFLYKQNHFALNTEKY